MIITYTFTPPVFWYKMDIPLSILSSIPLETIVKLSLKDKPNEIFIYTIGLVGLSYSLEPIDFRFIGFKVYRLLDSDNKEVGFVAVGSNISYTPTYLCYTNISYTYHTYEELLAAKIPIKLLGTFNFFNYFEYNGMCSLLIVNSRPDILSKFIEV